MPPYPPPLIPTSPARACIPIIYSPTHLITHTPPPVRLALAFPFYGVSGISISPAVKWAASFCAPTALALGLDTLFFFGANGQAPTWRNAHVPVAGYSVSTCLVALAVDCAIYFALALYLHEVVPSGPDNPAQQPWHFPISFPLCALRWGCSLRDKHLLEKREEELGSSLHYAQVFSVGDAAAASTATPSAVEPLDPSVFQSSQRASLRHVTKRYAVPAHSGVTRPAVDDVSLDLLPGQVTVLLGHNGAGKTTLVSMLSQQLAPTEGSMRVWGEDLHSRDGTSAGGGRSRLVAVCPQNDPLWPELTVAEHVLLFAKVKGVVAAQRECTALLQDVGLETKAMQLSGALSGGMKRRLCVALALTGDSKLVLLDEPTTGSA